MSQIHSKFCSPRATAPTIPYDISSLDPLPIEIQNVVYDKLLADPNLTFTLASLSKSHYTTLIPRLYERVEVTEQAVERGLFEDLLTGADRLEARGEGCLPSKRDLLENCKSLVVASLPAFDAITDAIQAWKALLAERRETGTVPDELDGIFNGVTHLAWGPTSSTPCAETKPKWTRTGSILETGITDVACRSRTFTTSVCVSPILSPRRHVTN
ncbi:hypothetical protein L198_01257 [Cryptococcus wingfieldii CBS 7118]|uniref:Uncharacterized protein n=1 Tax=Cryptococcus wingfieldii CBS 7118 TaxID=1295528 RepID=A0A1E3JYZ2_9TREE|nr:hypothetical protein L198_01257 [Cryptococcus wingfieldii CBS 7118]ODO06029.1 hypothetical protein L198_01257 [Cryptococcus wingfieldii CBS 7118]